MVNTYLQALLGSGGLQAQMTSLFPQIAEGIGGGLTQNAAGIGNLAGIDLGMKQFNVMTPYQEWIRSQTPPNLGAAIALATGQPQAPTSSDTGIPWGAIASIIAGIAMKSSRTLKEDIAPVNDVREKLKKLPIYTWKYKGDTQKHIGPMAEEFQETFGIGDGKTLHLNDLLGVMMASMKEQYAAG
jgi:hypothetical protein